MDILLKLFQFRKDPHRIFPSKCKIPLMVEWHPQFSPNSHQRTGNVISHGDQKIGGAFLEAHLFVETMSNQLVLLIEQRF